MSAPRLSICMPTYNYGRFIGTALHSVLAQWRDGVEIVVLDGGSSDDTPRIVEEFTERHPGVRYVRQDARGGIDRDMARSIELAEGEYCWLLSADDALADGALDRIMAEFDSGAQILLANRIWCDGELRPLRPERWLRDTPSDIDVDWAVDAQAEGYLSRARSLGALFSFMSCTGFRRDAWRSVSGEPGVGASHYAHAERLLRAARGGRILRHVVDPLILCRGGEDSFRSGGLAARLLIDLRGFDAVARAVFPDNSRLADSLRQVVLREHPARRWIRARAECADTSLGTEVERMLETYGCGSTRIVVYRWLGALLRMLMALRRPESGREAA